MNARKRSPVLVAIILLVWFSCGCESRLVNEDDRTIPGVDSNTGGANDNNIDNDNVPAAGNDNVPVVGNDNGAGSNSNGAVNDNQGAPVNDGNENSDTGAGDTEKADCEAANGVWQYWGSDPVAESCNLRASDAGLPCQDSSQCEGSCVAGLGSDGVCDALTGACSEFQVYYGCTCFVGLNPGGPQICVD